jgi:hypothetical protein
LSGKSSSVIRLFSARICSFNDVRQFANVARPG